MGPAAVRFLLLYWEQKMLAGGGVAKSMHRLCGASGKRHWLMVGAEQAQRKEQMVGRSCIAPSRALIFHMAIFMSKALRFNGR